MLVAAACHIPALAQSVPEIVHLPGREHLGPAINTADIEIAPVISPDGKTLYFDRKYSFDNLGGTNDDDDIYYSTLGDDGLWSPAKNIGAPLNTMGSDVLFWIAPEGDVALVHNGGMINGRIVGLAIWAIGHFAAVWAAKRDAQFVDVGRRHLRYPAHMDV